MTSAAFAETSAWGRRKLAFAQSSWPGRAERWLDDHGKGAWIAATILGFVLFWPIGLALLAYMIWSRRMFSKSCRGPWGHHRHMNRAEWETMRENWRQMGQTLHQTMRPTGNAAFDAYKAETIRRLTEEQEAFEAFLERLRQAKDKSEFDNFMDERARVARASGDAPEPPASAA